LTPVAQNNVHQHTYRLIRALRGHLGQFRKPLIRSGDAGQLNRINPPEVLIGTQTYQDASDALCRRARKTERNPSQAS